MFFRLAKLSVLLEKRDKFLLGQFTATNPTLDDYKDKLEFFSTLSAELKTQSHIDVGCIRIRYSEYNDRLIERCDFWHSAYGQQLIHECGKIMRQFSAHTTVNENQPIRIVIVIVLGNFERTRFDPNWSFFILFKSRIHGFIVTDFDTYV